jgi:histidyl-tRNA synthetase
LIGLGEAAEKEVTQLLYQLRLHGVNAEKDYLGRKMKAQMKSADRFQAKYVAILGDDELSRGEITLKTMSTGEQVTVTLVNFPLHVKTL